VRRAHRGGLRRLRSGILAAIVEIASGMASIRSGLPLHVLVNEGATHQAFG